VTDFDYGQHAVIWHYGNHPGIGGSLNFEGAGKVIMRWGGQPVTHNPYSQDRLLHRIVRREGVPGARKAPLCDPPCEVRGVGLTRGRAGQRDYSLRATVEYCTNCGNLLPGGKDTTGGASQAGGGSSVGQTDCWSRVLGQCLDAQARAPLACAARCTRRTRSIHRSLCTQRGLVALCSFSER
jgi:hypothetical protein